MAKYVESADHALDLAIATRPKPPAFARQRISLASQYIVQIILMNGDAVLLKDKKPDPNFLPSNEEGHIDMGAHGRMKSFSNESSVGVFRHEDESFNPYYQEFATLYPGRYRIRASFWSFGWDKGKVLPSRGVEAARLSAVQLTEDGRGGGHPSYVLGYYDAPSLEPKVHDFVTWLNFKETIGFNTASLAPVVNYTRKGRAMAFTGPGIANDWLDIEGPIHDVWPPAGHRLLFGDLPIVEFKPAEHAGIHRQNANKSGKRLSVPRISSIPSRASGRFAAKSHWPMRIGCSPFFCRKPFVGPLTQRFDRPTLPRWTLDSRPAIALSRPCAGRIAQHYVLPIFSITSNRRADWMTMHWPAGSRIFCGTQCPMRCSRISPAPGNSIIRKYFDPKSIGS